MQSTIPKIRVIQDDITQIEADVIVNAANSSLLGGGGVDGAIHRVGGKAILAECRAIRERQGQCPTGEAVITTAGDLPAKYVIHTVGPVWNGGRQNEAELLTDCYINSLKLAELYGAEHIAFPNISTGAYRFPKIWLHKLPLIQSKIGKVASLNKLLLFVLMRKISCFLII